LELLASLRVALAKVGMMTPTTTVNATTMPPKIQCSRLQEAGAVAAVRRKVNGCFLK
jgi:hypothetical protein